MTDTLLIGLAMLRANWDHSERSYIDNFVPFVADCLRDSTSTEGMSEAQVQNCVRQRFGVELPRGALKTVLRRAVRRGLARRCEGRFYPEQDALEGVPLSRQRDDVVREIEWLLTQFIEYLSVRHGEDWSREQAETALRGYVENWSIPLLRQSLTGGAAGEDQADQRETDYLVGSFVMHLRAEDPVGFGYLERLVKASMLTAGLYFEQGVVERPFSELTAYLDSPFILTLLGLHGEEEKVAAEEVVTLAADLGVDVACFPDTVSEVRGVLQGTARDLRSRRRSGSHVRLNPRLAAVELSATQLEELADRTEHSLRALGIGMRAKPKATAAGTTDTVALDAVLQERVGYAIDRTREHDATCLAAVHQIRSGQLQVQMDRARAIFITTNPKVVAAAAIHFDARHDPLTTPVAMMDHAFATLLWLKKPTAAPDLPWKQLVADCHAALNPDVALWNRYLDEIDALAARDDIDDETYFLMRHGHEARAALMERTHGRNDRLDERSVADIVDDARSAIQAPLNDRAKDAERRAAMAEAAVHELQAQTEQERAAAVAREAETVEQARRRERGESVARLASREADRQAARLALILRVGFGLVVGASVWAILSGSELAQLWGQLLGLGATVLALYGTSVPAILNRVKAWIAPRLESRIRRRMSDSLEPDPPEAEPASESEDRESVTV